MVHALEIVLLEDFGHWGSVVRVAVPDDLLTTVLAARKVLILGFPQGSLPFQDTGLRIISV